ncbi:MAG: hypothetical protein GX801_10480 [Fibrobacter sp.]|nr:hypothetical protein [Fibrobacter sp.]
MVLRVLMLLCVSLWAEITAELPNLQYLQKPTTLSLSGASLYHVSRAGQSSGPSSWESLWHPQNYAYFSPWNADFNAVRISLGNEVGDMLYQEIVHGPKLGNRTPTMQAQVSSPSLGGWRAMLNFAQNDHYGERFRQVRAQKIGAPDAASADHRWAWFGENYPGYSSLHGGITGSWNHNGFAMQLGRDYAWQLGRSGEWLGEKRQRIEAQGIWDTWVLQTYVQENSAAPVNGLSAGKLRDYYLALQWVHCGFQTGITLRKTDRQGDYPWLWKENALLLPWIALQKMWGKGGTWSFWGAVGEHWQLADTLKWQNKFLPERAVNLHFEAELRTWAASKYNPLAPDAEISQKDTINLSPSGYGWLQDARLSLSAQNDIWRLEGELIPWVENGALAFAPQSFSHSITSADLRDLPLDYKRRGAMQRLGLLWGLRKNLELSFKPPRHEFFAGFNHEQRSFRQVLDWEAPRHFFYGGARVAALPGMTLEHSWQYLGASYWQNWAEHSFKTPPHWVWNAAIKQEFPEQNLSLEAAWLGILASDQILMPQGNEDRSRFMCFLSYRF